MEHKDHQGGGKIVSLVRSPQDVSLKYLVRGGGPKQWSEASLSFLQDTTVPVMSPPACDEPNHILNNNHNFITPISKTGNPRQRMVSKTPPDQNQIAHANNNRSASLPSPQYTNKGSQGRQPLLKQSEYPGRHPHQSSDQALLPGSWPPPFPPGPAL